MPEPITLIDALAIAATSMQDDMRRLATLANNVANANTPGFKRAAAHSTQFRIALQQATGAVLALAAAPGAVPGSGASLDMTPGVQRPTGSALDVAIDGPGFFQVRLPDSMAYTRQGALSVAANGRLQLAGGQPVLDNGAEIVVAPGIPVEIARNGEVRQGNRVVGRLSVVRFDRPQAMQPVGGGLYAEGGARIVVDRSTPSVRPGHLEASNVNAAKEMIQLTEVARHFESMQRVVQGYDEVTMRAIRKFGEF